MTMTILMCHDQVKFGWIAVKILSPGMVQWEQLFLFDLIKCYLNLFKFGPLRNGPGGATALMGASRRGHSRIVELLLQVDSFSILIVNTDVFGENHIDCREIKMCLKSIYGCL